MQELDFTSDEAAFKRELTRLERENRRLQRKIVNLQDVQNRMRDLAIGKQAVDKVKDEEKQKQDRYMALLQANVPDIILMFDKEGRLINCTDSFLTAIGVHGFSQVTGRRTAEIMAAYSLGSSHDSESIFLQVISEGKSFATTARFDFSGDGLGREYEVLTAPIMGDDGKPDGVVSLIHDITDLIQRERMVNALNEMATMFLSQTIETFEKTLAEGIGIIVDLIHLDRVTFWRNTAYPSGFYASQIYHWEWHSGLTALESKGTTSPVEVKVIPRWEELFLRGETINAQAHAIPEARYFEQYGSKLVFVTPIRIEGEFWGFVIFEDQRREDVFTTSEASILRSAALMMGNAMNSYEEAVRTQDADERTRLLLNATPMGCQIIDRTGVIIDCNEAAVQMFGFKNKTEFLEKARVISARNPEFQPDGRLSEEKATEFMQRAFEKSRHTFEWMHTASDGTPLPTEVTLVRVQYKAEDVLAAYTWDLRITRRMEESIKWLESEVDKIYIDPLTGINNRRYFEETLSDTMAFLSRSNSFLSVLMIDIDSFKTYNDYYGHPEGDKCLVTIAEALDDTLVRKDDFVARYGGEEFVVVLPNTNQKGACIIADKLLQSIRACAILHEKSRAAQVVTVSIGVTTGVVHHGQSRDAYIKRADEMLYQAKQKGGDCSFFAPL